MTRFAALLFLLLTFAPLAYAQNDRLAEQEAEITAAAEELSDIGDDLSEDNLRNAAAVESRLREMLAQSRSRLSTIEAALKDAEERLDLLPPAPKEGEPPESESFAARRSSLQERIARLEAARNLIVANIDKTGSLLSSVSTRRVLRFYENMLERGSALVSPELWVESADEFNTLAGKITAYFGDWRERKTGTPGGVVWPSLIMAAGLVFSFLMFGPVHRWMRRSFTERVEKLEPTSGRRVAVAGVKMIARLVPGLIGGLFIIETARVTGLLPTEGLAVARSIWMALIAFLLVEGFTSGLFAPASPNWRIADLEARQGRRASILILSIVGVFGLKSIFTAIAGAADIGPSLIRLLDGLSAVLIGGLLFLLCRRSLWRRAPAAAPAGDAASMQNGDGETMTRLRLLRRSLRVIAVFIVIAALVGYIALADFAASRFYYLALILSVAWFVRAVVKEFAAWAERRIAVREDGEDLSEKDDKQILQFWVGASVDVVLLMALAPALLILAGFGWENVRDIAMRAFLGFRIGGVTISISDILAAIGVFLLILALTRAAQTGLKRGPFAHSRLDAGVQNSLTTLVGYAGLLLAMVFGISVLGFNLSNLAIIAGALSVGIGFGLQSIVNNFVSGLILLFERPVKVGDWIVTNSGEGTVKKISVRSTEIETFDRSSIIVPNSELISSTVTNWTHRNAIGRITVPVGVAYNSDPEQVKQILLDCAHDHPEILSFPEAFVVWKDFGSSSLDFEVRAFLQNISKGLSVRTELRFAIFKALKEAGVEIPFPQQDIYVKSLPEGALPKGGDQKTSLESDGHDRDDGQNNHNSD